jgi:flavin reductase (DIM6/NTAB) family NADH-FMN oxidoreductase RutF
MRVRKKHDFPVDRIRRFIEPGPVVLISSNLKGETNIMTCGWHMVMGYDTIGCFIWDQNRSFGMIRKSRECVINIPAADMAKTVVGIGNTSGAGIDKFAEFGLTALPGERVQAPLIGECFANLECRLADTGLIGKYSLFVFEVVKAHAPKSPRLPDLLHYSGDGIFAVSDRTTNLRKRFKPDMLED